MTVNKLDCIVVGGGVIGLLTARALMERGLGVRLFEKARESRSASWAAGGILSPLSPWRCDPAVSRLCREGQRRYVSLAADLLAETGVDIEWLRSGMLILNDARRDLADQWAATHGERILHLSHTQLDAEQAGLSARIQSGILLESIAQLRPPQLLSALRASLEARGCQFERAEEVVDLKREGGRVIGVGTASGSTYSAGKVVIAAGAWSQSLLARAGCSDAGIRPVRGQMILYAPGAARLNRILVSDEYYAIPRRDGRILIGSTLEEVGFDTATTAQAARLLHRRACALLPALDRATIEHHWAGLRPATGREAPYVCNHPELENLYVSTGHFRNGIVQAPASAELLAELLIDNRPGLDPKPYAWTPSASRSLTI